LNASRLATPAPQNPTARRKSTPNAKSPTLTLEKNTFPTSNHKILDATRTRQERSVQWAKNNFPKKSRFFEKVHEIDLAALENPRSAVQNDRQENAIQPLDSR
jgi:hypothetical protein